MLRVINSAPFASNKPNRRAIEYTVELFNALTVDFLVIQDLRDGAIFVNTPKFLGFTDRKLYTDVKELLKARFLEDTKE